MKTKRYMLGILSTLAILVAIAGAYVYREMGDSPTQKEMSQFTKLPYFVDGRFVNFPNKLSPEKDREFGTSTMIKQMSEDAVTISRSKRIWHLISNFVLPGNQLAPTNPLPRVFLSKKSFPDKPEKFAFYWLGHNSTILEIGGKRIGIDLVFGSASPVPLTVRRYQDAPLSRDDLPDLDFILITHNHYDHLERATITSIKKGHFIVPLGVGAILRGWGISPNRITELSWGDIFRQGGIKITAVESVHFSGRKLSDGNKTLWCSYIVSTDDTKIFWGCDGGYGSHFSKIGEKYGPFDMCALETDAWNAGWPTIHMFPPQTVQAAEDLRAKYLFPMHWGTYTLGFHNWRKSIDKVVKLSKQKSFNLLTPKMGEKCVPGTTKTSHWWKDIN